MTASSSDRPKPAVIQVASGLKDGHKRSVPCNFNGLNGKRLTLRANEPVGISRPVSVEYEDALFLGEVIACSGIDGAWSVEIKVEQILTGLQSLLALRERLAAEGVPQPLSMLPIGARN